MVALQNGVIPDRYVTVFAGVTATRRARARAHDGLSAVVPSMGLFKDGKLVFMLQRTDLQQMNEEQVASALAKAFHEHCGKPGPSIDPESFNKIRPIAAAARRFLSPDPEAPVWLPDILRPCPGAAFLVLYIRMVRA